MALLVEIAFGASREPDVKLYHTYVPFGELVSPTPRMAYRTWAARDRRPGSALRREAGKLKVISAEAASR
jgi:hypothetical protein